VGDEGSTKNVRIGFQVVDAAAVHQRRTSRQSQRRGCAPPRLICDDGQRKMDSILYVYVPVITVAEVRSLLQVLKDSPYSITHLGKNDPPKKWSGAPSEAENIILTGTDETVYSFIRDAKRKFDMTIEIHKDPRWRGSTISASLPEEGSLRILGMNLVAHIKSFAAILGRSGGKDQAWEILHLSSDCPPELAAKFSKKEPIQSTTDNSGAAPLRV
jgi:hypothetical protein